MTFSVFIPSRNTGEKYPYLLYLSGLTCSDENVCMKSGIFKYLCEKKIAFVAPDTSPRGAGIAGESDSWDFGAGAGFYLDATQDPWKSNWQMYSYITKELPTLLEQNVSHIDSSRVSIMGHSMGGHGALTIALKNPTAYRSVSALAPICNPTNTTLGKKAFNGYLGADANEWLPYDACEVVRGSRAPGDRPSFDDILLDMGTEDSFYQSGVLLPEAFVSACGEVGQPVTLRLQSGFDHSYYFVASFIEDHVAYHAQRLNA